MLVFWASFCLKCWYFPAYMNVGTSHSIAGAQTDLTIDKTSLETTLLETEVWMLQMWLSWVLFCTSWVLTSHRAGLARSDHRSLRNIVLLAVLFSSIQMLCVCSKTFAVRWESDLDFVCLFSRLYQVRLFFSLKCICPAHERKQGEEELAGISWTTIYCRTGFQLSASAPCKSMVSILLLKSESSNVANTYFSLSKHFTYSWVCRQLLGYIFSPILLKQDLHFFWNHFSLVWEQKVDTRADKWQHLA